MSDTKASASPDLARLIRVRSSSGRPSTDLLYTAQTEKVPEPNPIQRCKTPKGRRPRVKFTKLAPILVVLVALPLAASAGGWALTSFDEMPTEFAAGETYGLSYTILQHGKTPVDVGSTSVLVTDSGGKVTEFEATSTGEVGRYTVQVTFPESGTFTWQVSQGPFQAHDLGSVDVAAGSTIAASSLTSTLLPIAFALVIGLLGVQIFALIRKRSQSVRAD